MNKLRVVSGFSCAVALASLSIIAWASAQTPQDLSAQLKACASINEPGESLACFKQLAARASPSLIAPSAAPVATATPVSPPSPVAVPKESFGLHAAEHPAAPKTDPSHTAKVVAVGTTTSGRPTVTLEGGEVWELDAADPLLAQGNSVTITRGTFHSFVMTTPTGRTHRVQRLH
jgi:hypothetical protein